MLPRLADIETFLHVAKLGAFRRAALDGKILQSTISRRVARLEDTLGVSLFERNSRGVRLTNAGKAFESRVSSVFNDLGEAVRFANSAGEGKTGRLRLGVMEPLTSAALQSLVIDHSRRCPNILLDVCEDRGGELLSSLIAHETDVFFADRSFQRENLDDLEIAEEPLWIVVPREHLLATKPNLDWADLDGATFLSKSFGIGPALTEALHRSSEESGISLRVEIHSVSQQTLIHMVGMGTGLSLCPETWATYAPPGVVFLKVNHPPSLRWHLFWSPRNDNPVLRRFVSQARIVAKKNGVLS